MATGKKMSNQEILYKLSQSEVYPAKDTNSELINTPDGFRVHSWGDEQYNKVNYTDEVSYLKGMPKGYKLDMAESYPIQSNANGTSNATANSTKKTAEPTTGSEETTTEDGEVATKHA